MPTPIFLLTEAHVFSKVETSRTLRTALFLSDTHYCKLNFNFAFRIWHLALPNSFSKEFCQASSPPRVPSDTRFAYSSAVRSTRRGLLPSGLET